MYNQVDCDVVYVGYLSAPQRAPCPLIEVRLQVCVCVCALLAWSSAPRYRSVIR